MPIRLTAKRVGQVPGANGQLTEQLVKLSDQVRGAVLRRDSGTPFAQQPPEAVDRRAVEVKHVAILLEGRDSALALR